MLGARARKQLLCRSGSGWGRLTFRLGFAFRSAAGIGLRFGFGFALGFALGVGLGVRFAIAGGRGRFSVAAVIGDVESRALELERRNRDQPLQFAAAILVNGEYSVREFLPDLESFTTQVTSVIVKWHSVFLLNPRNLLLL